MSWVKEDNMNWLQCLVLNVIKSGRTPKHVAIIMDGNRRYARKVGVEKYEGHARGFDKLTETLRWCIKFDVKEVTVYAFSIENFRRSKQEVNNLMELFRIKLRDVLKKKDEFKKLGLCIRIVGNMSLVPDDIRKLIAATMITTRDNNKIVLNIAFCYTFRDELTHTMKDILKGVKHKDILPEDISEDLISDCLYIYSKPDLLIRTSGETRLSDFLMWQVSDSCIYFTDVLWPDLRIWDFFKAIFYYQRCYSDLQRFAKKSNRKPTAHNNRVSAYIDKLRRERQADLEHMSTISSTKDAR